MGYVKSKTLVKVHCENCDELVTKCENCMKNLHWKTPYVLCSDETFGGHYCSTKCYDEKTKRIKEAKRLCTSQHL
jgi:hypothetical protein